MKQFIRRDVTVTPRFTKMDPGPHDVCIKVVETFCGVRGHFYSECLQSTTLPNATKEEAQEAGKNLLELYLMSRQSLTGK